MGNVNRGFALSPGNQVVSLPLALDDRECTCHPDDNPPCPRKFALSECIKAATVERLVKRCEESMARIAAMCKEHRGPKMTIPADPERDDDLFICNTLREIRALLDQEAK